MEDLASGTANLLQITVNFFLMSVLIKRCEATTTKKRDSRTSSRSDHTQQDKTILDDEPRSSIQTDLDSRNSLQASAAIDYSPNHLVLSRGKVSYPAQLPHKEDTEKNSIQLASKATSSDTRKTSLVVPQKQRGPASKAKVSGNTQGAIKAPAIKITASKGHASKGHASKVSDDTQAASKVPTSKVPDDSKVSDDTPDNIQTASKVSDEATKVPNDTATASKVPDDIQMATNDPSDAHQASSEVLDDTQNSDSDSANPADNSLEQTEDKSERSSPRSQNSNSHTTRSQSAGPSPSPSPSRSPQNSPAPSVKDEEDSYSSISSLDSEDKDNDDLSSSSSQEPADEEEDASNRHSLAAGLHDRDVASHYSSISSIHESSQVGQEEEEDGKSQVEAETALEEGRKSQVTGDPLSDASQHSAQAEDKQSGKLVNNW